MTKVVLLSGVGNADRIFEIPPDQDRELGRCGGVLFRGQCYRYTNMTDDTFYFEPSSPSMELKEEWMAGFPWVTK
jgi:hypothetical protein